jgi:hypothetical protein
LIYRDVVRESAKKVELRLDPSEDLLVGNEELDIARSPQISNSGTAQMSNKRHIGDYKRGYEDEDERCSPGRDFVWPDAEVWVCFVSLHGFGGEEKKDPYTVPVSMPL